MQEEKMLMKSIKRLIDLNVSDKEILLNLKDIGVDEEKARELIAKAKGLTAAPKMEKQGKGKRKEVVEKPPAEEVEELAEELAGEKEEKVSGEEIEKAKQRMIARKKVTKSKPAISELWKKGILVTVTQKLEEMKKLRKELDAVLDEKVQKTTEKELKKMQILMDSQKTLLTEKVTSQLESKASEIEDVIDIKIAEMNALNKEIKKNLEAAEMKRAEQKNILEGFDKTKKELEELKNSLLSEMNSELIKEKSNIEEVLEKATGKINEMEGRVDKTLELESSIVDGLVGDTEAKIEKITEEKREELVAGIEEEIAKMEEIRGEIDPQRIKEKIGALEEKKEELEVLKNNVADETLGFVSGEMRKLKEENRKEIQEFKKALVDEVKKEVDLVGIKAERENLEVFKKQFVNTISKNVEKFNSSVNETNSKASEMVEQFNVRADYIDEKIKELDAFEKNFAKEMGLKIEKLTEKKSKAKALKKK